MDRGVWLAADHGVAHQYKWSNLIPMHVKVLYDNSQVSRRELGFHSRARRSHWQILSNEQKYVLERLLKTSVQRTDNLFTNLTHTSVLGVVLGSGDRVVNNYLNTDPSSGRDKIKKQKNKTEKWINKVVSIFSILSVDAAGSHYKISMLIVREKKTPRHIL